MTEASATVTPPMPRTEQDGSSAARGSPARPIAQVPHGMKYGMHLVEQGSGCFVIEAPLAGVPRV